jgi:hypothetical protein
MKTEKFDILADDYSYITLSIISDENGVHWEIASDAWNEIQPPDKTMEHCIADLIENMRVYHQLGVIYAGELFAFASGLDLPLG